MGDAVWPGSARTVLLAPRLSDPANVGGLMRVAAAFDCAVVLGAQSADVWNPATLRASAGAVFGLLARARLARTADVRSALRQAAASDYRIFVAVSSPHDAFGCQTRAQSTEMLSASSAAPASAFLAAPRALVVLGHETGFEQDDAYADIVSAADGALCIDACDAADSLNVHVAASIFGFLRRK